MHTLALIVFVLFSNTIRIVRTRPMEENLLPFQREIFFSPSNFTTPDDNEETIKTIWNHIQPMLINHMNSHLSHSFQTGCNRTNIDIHIQDEGDFVEHCLEKVFDINSQSYHTKTTATLHKIDGTIIPLHEAESNLQIYHSP